MDMRPSGIYQPVKVGDDGERWNGEADPIDRGAWIVRRSIRGVRRSRCSGK